MGCWHGICLEWGANDLHMVQLMQVLPIISCFFKIQNALPFCCQFIHIVLEKRPLNRCSVVVSVLSFLMHHFHAIHWACYASSFKYTLDYNILVCRIIYLCHVTQVRLYMRLPLNAASRLWGRLNNLDLPVWVREPVFSLYIRLFHCNMSEAAVTDLRHYHNLGELFRRQLKPESRPVDCKCPLVCYLYLLSILFVSFNLMSMLLKTITFWAVRQWS